MFIVSLHYVGELERIDALLEEHRTFLQRYYDAGNFIVSGRKEPRTGGIIIARAKSRDILEKIIAEDPFNREKVAEYQITEFVPTKFASSFAVFCDGIND